MKFVFALLIVSSFFSTPLVTHAMDLFDTGMPVPHVTIRTISPTTISFSYGNLSNGTKIYLVSQFDFKAYELKLQKNAPSTGQISQGIPSKVLNSQSQTQYRLEARATSGYVEAKSEVFQTGSRNKKAPSCTIEASQYVVGAGELFSIKWSGSSAEYALPALGFSKTKEGEQYSVKNKMKLSSNLSGNNQYGILFQGASGNQAYCMVFVNVIGSEPSGTIDEENLTNASPRQTLTGTAFNTKKVVVVVSDQEKGGGQVWMSKPLTVKDGKWSVKISPALPYSDYDYTIELMAYDKGQYTQLVSYKTLSVE